MLTKLIIPVGLGLLFLAFGLYLLVISYYQEDPFLFLALFFSSSFIVLISGAIVIGLIWRAVTTRGEERRVGLNSNQG